jgi:hypothetical protein
MLRGLSDTARPAKPSPQEAVSAGADPTDEVA